MTTSPTWTELASPGKGNDTYKLNGAGEMLVFSAADFEDFLEPRPILQPFMEAELKKVVGLLVEKRWPFRLHATYDESISRFLDVFEGINREIPFNGLRWFFDHAETISEKNMERVHRLGGGIAIQDRMAFQGEYFVERYGPDAAKMTPPITKMLSMGIPVGAGTDATRVSSYNPWVSLYWLVSGNTVGGLPLYDEQNLLDRTSALRLYSEGSSWFSGDDGKKGRIAVGQLADLAVLSADYFAVPVGEIKGIEAILTVMGGRIVHGAGEFGTLAPPSNCALNSAIRCCKPLTSARSAATSSSSFVIRSFSATTRCRAASGRASELSSTDTPASRKKAGRNAPLSSPVGGASG